jgi:hypothetical protein
MQPTIANGSWWFAVFRYYWFSKKIWSWYMILDCIMQGQSWHLAVQGAANASKHRNWRGKKSSLFNPFGVLYIYSNQLENSWFTETVIHVHFRMCLWVCWQQYNVLSVLNLFYYIHGHLWCLHRMELQWPTCNNLNIRCLMQYKSQSQVWISLQRCQ